MAYADLPAKTAGDTITLANYDQIRDNFDACAVDNFTTKGDLFVGTGTDVGARKAAGANDSIIVYDSSTATGIDDQIVPAVIVNNSGVFDPSTSTWEFVTWDSEGLDTNGMHSTISNTDRLTVPTGGDGIYFVSANIQFDTTSISAGTSIQLGARLVVNGVTVYRRSFDEMETSAVIDYATVVCGLLDLNATNYVSVQVWTSLDINVTADSRFEMIWMRRP